MIYRPARKRYGDWASASIDRPLTRQRLANQLRAIRREHDSAEADAYRGYLYWLGTYPVALRWWRVYDAAGEYQGDIMKPEAAAAAVATGGQFEGGHIEQEGR